MADDESQETPQPSSGNSPGRDDFRNRRYGRRRRRGGLPQQQPPAEGGQAATEQPKQVPSGSNERPHPQQHDPDITVVIPLYNEEESLKELHRQLRDALGRTGRRYDLIFVDDGSTDNSYGVLRDLKRFDPRHVRIVRFRRNYGKSAALSVGFEKARGRTVVTMDADLQDDPAEIPSLLRKMSEGFDLVSGWKRKRRDPLSKTIPSRFFNYVTGILTGIKIHDFNCGLKAYKREVVKTVKVYGELHRYVPVLAHWEGFKVGEVMVQHRARKFGHTKFGITRFWRGFLDLLTVLFTTRYFRKPLHLFGFWGLMATVAGTIIVGYLVILWFLGVTSLTNRPLFLGGIMLIIVGIQFISIGLLGEMISKTKQADDQYSIREYIP
jgi:glycosyltransferase involved in cell wall biosynthesis